MTDAQRTARSTGCSTRDTDRQPFEPLGSERTRAGASPLACQTGFSAGRIRVGICAAMSGCARREPWAAAVRSLFAIYSSQIWSPRPSAKLRVEQFGCEDLLDLPWPRGQALLVAVAQARFERCTVGRDAVGPARPSGRGGRPQSQRRVAASVACKFVPRMRRLPAETTSDRGSVEANGRLEGGRPSARLSVAGRLDTRPVMAEPTCAVDRSPRGLTRSSATAASNRMAIPASEKPTRSADHGGSVTDELCQRPELLLPVSPGVSAIRVGKRFDDRAAHRAATCPGVSQCSAGSARLGRSPVSHRR